MTILGGRNEDPRIAPDDDVVSPDDDLVVVSGRDLLIVADDGAPIRAVNDVALLSDPDQVVAILDRSDVRRDPFRRAVKRAFDVATGIVALVVCVPVMLAIALAIGCTSRGPMLYVHRRVGRNGRTFPLVKFRTMRCDADAVLAEHLARHPELARQWARSRKLNPDPRVTRVGRLMRRASLDELPQLLNVIAGHMSIVGPRPVMEDELAHYGARQDEILALRPGLTGLWAVSGRSDVGYEERAELEHRYVRTWGIRRDLAIVLRTIPAVFRGSGAY
jgi:exopolysaccharide production protein ExoY